MSFGMLKYSKRQLELLRIENEEPFKIVARIGSDPSSSCREGKVSLERQRLFLMKSWRDVDFTLSHPRFHI